MGVCVFCGVGVLESVCLFVKVCVCICVVCQFLRTGVSVSLSLCVIPSATDEGASLLFCCCDY